ncbi:Major viral transcription factor [Senna tora]|uniref:Major viral transcription factor n=1 Tax=Senna tora TaxID=362788 RepID=A0A834W601_9FABA|nr:Major viral transcription factor [Senna tora]
MEGGVKVEQAMGRRQNKGKYPSASGVESDLIEAMEAKAGQNNATRLQKRAPASLQLDKVNSVFPTNPFDPSHESSNAIPLLSPLILSPQPLMETKEARMSEIGNNNCSNVQGICCSSSMPMPMPATGWQHPAMAPPFPEPSSLLSFFQKQCVIVNHAQ